MAEVIGSILIVLGLAYKVLIRAPYTHNKQTFSFIRNTMTYIRLLLILLYKSPDSEFSLTISEFLSQISNFVFPLHSFLSALDKQSQQNFFYLILINATYVLLMFIAKFFYTGYIRLKFSMYLIEIVSPDLIIYLVYNFLNLSTIDSYLQTLGFLITLTLYISVCIIGPVVIMHDQEPYKDAKIMFTGLKNVRKEW